MRPEDRMAQRRVAWFRHVEEVTHNVARTRRYQLSQATIWRFLQRAETSRLPSNMRTYTALTGGAARRYNALCGSRPHGGVV